jgi:formiminotetrahydrofolate cyclodeaminase
MNDEPLASLQFDTLLESLAAKTPTPGGGAAASAAAALGAALAGMVVSFSLGKKNLAAHEPALQDAARRLSTARTLFLKLADEDAAAYGAVNELSKLPETDPRRATELPGAVLASVQVPLAVMAACADLLRLMEQLAPITNRHLRSDLAIAAVLAESASRSSQWNVLVNLSSLPSQVERQSTADQAAALLAVSSNLCKSVETACRA